jgi:serine/threonine protein kinase
LDYAHARKIVHLDIKAANVFLIPSEAEYELVKVIDFGLARIVQSTLGHTLSRVVGTPQYIAPEVYQNQASSLSDVYSLGVLSFEMLTGVMPFSNTQIHALIADHLKTPPPSARTYCKQLTQYNDELISLALAKDPTERPQTAGLFAKSFQKGLAADGPLIVFEKKPILRTTVVYLDDPFVGKPSKSIIGTFLTFLLLAAPFISIALWYAKLDFGYLQPTTLVGIYLFSIFFATYKAFLGNEKWNQVTIVFKGLIILLLVAPAALFGPFFLIGVGLYTLVVLIVGGKFYRNRKARIVDEERSRAKLE